MNRFDDDLRRATAPLAGEPLPEGILDESLDQAAPAETRVPWAGAALAAVVVVVVAVVGAPLLDRGLPGVVPTITPPTVLPSVVALTQSPTVAPSPEPTASGRPSSTPTASASPRSSMEPAVPVVASNESDGILITLALDRNRVAQGQRVWATVTLQNRGADSVWWAHSGTCVFPTRVFATPETFEPMPSGRGDWTGHAGTLRSISVFEEYSELGFAPEERVDVDLPFGCTTDRNVSEITPGEVIVSRSAWDAERFYGLPAVPGNYTVTADFHYDARGSARPTHEPLPPDQPSVSVEVQLIVTGSEIDYLSPAQAVDRLLEDETFAAELSQRPVERWLGAEIEFADGTWAFELRLDSPPEALVGRVDAVSGEVTGVEVEPRGDPYGEPP